MMWQFTSHSGLATVVLDYTNELSLLGYGLFGLIALSGGLIALAAIKHSLFQRGKPAVTTASPPTAYDTAA